MAGKFTKVVQLTMMMCLLIFFCFACGGQYDDIVEVNQEFVEILEKYAASLEKSDNAKDVAAAINAAADGLEILAPKMHVLKEKYADLETQKELPEKLLQSEKDMERVGEKLQGSFMTLAKYIGDSEVMAAQMRMTKAMQSASK